MLFRAWVIFDFSRFKVNLISLEKKVFISARMLAQSSLLPMTPIIKSSAYLTNLALLYCESTCIRELMSSLCISSSLPALESFLQRGLILCRLPLSKLQISSSINLSNLSRRMLQSMGLTMDPWGVPNSGEKKLPWYM